MNAAIDPMQFDLFDLPVLIATQKPRLVHRTSPVAGKKTWRSDGTPTHSRCTAEFRKVVAMATAHTSLGMHERSLLLLATLARIDARAATDWYSSLPVDHRLRTLWDAFGSSRARFCPHLFPAFVVIAEPCLRLHVTGDDLRSDTTDTLGSACTLLQRWIDAGDAASASRQCSSEDSGLKNLYRIRMASVRLKSLPRKPSANRSQASTL